METVMLYAVTQVFLKLAVKVMVCIKSIAGQQVPRKLYVTC